MLGQTDDLLICQGVTKRFGALAAIDNLSFSVKQGEVLGIGGPNGAGKTALFDAISGINACTEGSISFGGVRIDRLRADQICHLGLSRTFQLNSGFDSLTVLENLKVSRYFGKTNRKFPGVFFDRRTIEDVNEVIDTVGLGPYAHEQVRNLPVFQRKLLMIAGALSRQPRLLMLDEPVGGLTPAEIDKILDLIRQISLKNVTVILIEHVMRFLLELSDRILILNRGQRLYEGDPQGVILDPGVIEVFLGERTARSLAENRA